MPETKVFIFGCNGHEHAWVKPRDKGKRFFETKNQTYRTYAHGFVRMKEFPIDSPTGDSEVIIYDENALVPRDNPNGIDYTLSAGMIDIDLDKKCYGDPKGKKITWSNIPSLFDKYGKYLVIALIAGIVLYCVLTGEGA